MRKSVKSKLMKLFEEMKINSDKELMDLKIYKLMEFSEKFSITIEDIKAIWEIQKALVSDNKFKLYIDN